MLNTKLLMTVSAVVLGLGGLAVSFAPDELLEFFDVAEREPLPSLLKIMGGLYLGFAIMNWTAKGNMIGGIYGRPVAIGNFLQFFVGAIVLAKLLVAGATGAAVIAALVVYAVFCVLFGWLVFGRGGACAVAGEER